MTTEADRAAFEAWWTRERAMTVGDEVQTDFSWYAGTGTGRTYIRCDIQSEWEAWQAAHAAGRCEGIQDCIIQVAIKGTRGPQRSTSEIMKALRALKEGDRA